MNTKNNPTATAMGTTVCAGILFKPTDGKSLEAYIEKYLINQIGELVPKYQELSYILITAGIEFLGKYISNNGDIHKGGESRPMFENAIN